MIRYSHFVAHKAKNSSCVNGRGVVKVFQPTQCSCTQIGILYSLGSLFVLVAEISSGRARAEVVLFTAD